MYGNFANLKNSRRLIFFFFFTLHLAIVNFFLIDNEVSDDSVLLPKSQNINLLHVKGKNVFRTPGTPAFRARSFRKKKEKISSSTVIDVDAVSDTCQFESMLTQLDSSHKDIVSSPHIPKTDITILRSSSWLTESLINAGMELLKTAYPHVKGFQNCSLSDTLMFEPLKNDFIQILNCERKHWICVSTIDCANGKIKVYDSLRTGDIPLTTQESISTLLHTTKKSVSLMFPDVQQQDNSFDCGLFALAYASSICQNIDPATVLYEKLSLRSHFLSCLVNKEFIPFPYKLKEHCPKPPIRRSFKVYCFCRLPDTGDEMIQCNVCKEWYHFICVSMETKKKVPGVWICNHCLNN